MDSIQVSTSLHVRPSQLFHVLLVQPLLSLALRHVQPQYIEETHLQPAKEPPHHACTLHQPVRRHRPDYPNRTRNLRENQLILLSLLSRDANASLARYSDVI